jgi:hypothetical protein
LLSPNKRELDAQQYLTNADEAAAWKEEMKDWYFALYHGTTALKELNVGGYEHREKELPELQKVEQMVKPCSVRSADRPEMRRKSPYSVDLRQRQCATRRPRSVPASLVGGRCENRASVQKHSSPQKREVHLEAARPEVGRPDVPVVRSPAKHDVVEMVREPTRTNVNEKSSPNLKSAAAIESWLSQANERLAEAFSGAPPAAVQGGDIRNNVAICTKEDTKSEQVQALPHEYCTEKRPDSLAATGTTVYEPTTRPPSVGSSTPALQSVGLSSKPFESSDVRSQPGIRSAASLDMSLSHTELQTVPQQAQVEAELEIARSCSPLAVAVPLDTNAPKKESTEPVGISGHDRESNDSEHYSEDELEEDEDPYAAESFNISAMSAEVVSDRGSSRSDVSLSDGPTRGIISRAVDDRAESERGESSVSSSSISPSGQEEVRRQKTLSHHASSASLLSGEEERRESSVSISPSRREELRSSRSFSRNDKRNDTTGSYDEEYEDFDGSYEDTSSLDIS